MVSWSGVNQWMEHNKAHQIFIQSGVPFLRNYRVLLVYFVMKSTSYILEVIYEVFKNKCNFDDDSFLV
jgi:hypothetical protein